MGWDFKHVDTPNSIIEEVENEYTWSNACRTFKPIKSAIVDGVVYLALECIDTETQERTVEAMVVQTYIEYGVYCNFGMKGIHEDCGPCFYDCPASILNLLTPTTSKWALEWREACWKQIHQNQTQIKKGNTKLLSELPLNSKILIYSDDYKQSIELTKLIPEGKVRPVWSTYNGNTYSMKQIVQIPYEILS